MAEPIKLAPGKGSADVRLGMSKAEVVGLLGTPALASDLPDGAGEKLSYPGSGIAVFLRGQAVDRLYFCGDTVQLGPVRIGMATDELPAKFASAARVREGDGFSAYDVNGVSAFLTGEPRVVRGVMIVKPGLDAETTAALKPEPPEMPPTGSAPSWASATADAETEVPGAVATEPPDDAGAAAPAPEAEASLEPEPEPEPEPEAVSEPESAPQPEPESRPEPEPEAEAPPEPEPRAGHADRRFHG
jgi:hypothetical protein